MAKKRNGRNPSAIEWAEAVANDPEHQAAVDELLTETHLQHALIELREKAGLTQVQLAERAGVKQPLISRLESGKLLNTELKTVVKLAAALRTRVRIVFEPVRKAKAGKKTAAA